MLHLDLMLKNNELCLFGRPQQRSGMDESGLFVRDTRFLSRFETRILGKPLEILDLRQVDAATLELSAAAPELFLDPEPGGTEQRRLQGQSLFVEQRIWLTDALHVRTRITNFDGQPVAVPLQIELGVDFRDMFDVRGMTPKTRPTIARPVIKKQRVTFTATGSDGVEVSTRVALTPAPGSAGVSHEKDSGDVVTLSWPLTLGHGESSTVELTITPTPPGAPLVAAPADGDNAAFRPRLHFTSANPAWDAFFRQCDADLALLYTSFPEGEIPAAGIPWFIAPFGRDSLIVALQTMHVYPDRAASTLRVLAALQGTKDDPWREEEPGKIAHEMRYGDMARSGQAPHSPYYGSVDATPLFVMTVAEYDRWHGSPDDPLFDDLLPHVKRALAWIETRGDLDGDGLVEFGAKANDAVHITQQGWKDSFDSLHFADGREVEGPIALVEVQGYLYAAYAGLAEAVRRRGDVAWADDLAARAERLRRTVEDRFWMERAGYYAQALDGRKQQVDAISSNPGHLLFCRLPSPERAAQVAAMLASPELDCGWGVRTLGMSMATYNPLSYHNGSIWPHDSSLAMAGLAAYGFHEQAAALAAGLVDLSRHAPGKRLAELYCGFPQEPDRGPVNYPVSCIPQAWAAGSGLLAVRALLGLHPDPETRTVAPSGDPPTALGNLSVEGLAAFGRTFAITTG
ncbi:MAG: glycogen debranching N-terminal domain-containing protein [Thermomicrobiales bacterium]